MKLSNGHQPRIPTRIGEEKKVRASPHIVVEEPPLYTKSRETISLSLSLPDERRNLETWNEGIINFERCEKKQKGVCGCSRVIGTYTYLIE